MSQPFSDIRFRLHNLHEDFSEMQEEIQNETENCLTESEPKVKKKIQDLNFSFHSRKTFTTDQNYSQALLPKLFCTESSKIELILNL